MNKWIEEFAGFASRNRRRTAAEGKLIGGCCADAVESPTGGAKEKTIRTGWSFSLLLVSLRSKEFAGFASRRRCNIAPCATAHDFTCGSTAYFTFSG